MTADNPELCRVCGRREPHLNHWGGLKTEYKHPFELVAPQSEVDLRQPLQGPRPINGVSLSAGSLEFTPRVPPFSTKEAEGPFKVKYETVASGGIMYGPNAVVPAQHNDDDTPKIAAKWANHGFKEGRSSLLKEMDSKWEKLRAFLKDDTERYPDSEVSRREFLEKMDELEKS